MCCFEYRIKKSTTLYRGALSFFFFSVDIGPANTDTVSILDMIIPQ